MRQFSLIMFLIVLAGNGRAMAALTILDFEALAHTEDPVKYDFVNEDGFTLSTGGSSRNDQICITGTRGVNDTKGGYQANSYKGSTTAWTFNGDTTYVVRDNSDPFNLESIDLARFSSHWTGSVQVTIYGYDNHGAQVAGQSFTLPETGDESLHTYTLDSSFSGIYKAGWTQREAYFQFDNIVISDIPEPCTTLLLALGGFAALRKRRKD